MFNVYKRFNSAGRGCLCLLIFFAALFVSCEQVTIGLGSQEDIVPPEFKGGIRPESGGFLNADNSIFSGTAQDDMGVAGVEVYVDGRWIPVDSFDPESGNWKYNLDTVFDLDGRVRQDGPMTVKFAMIDNSGKRVETQSLSYTIKNQPPQIELSLPSVAGGNFDDRLHLANLDPLYEGGAIMGIASDVMGIMAGYPKIMMWPADEEPPEDIDANWHTVREKDGVTDVNQTGGLVAIQFRWPLKDYAVGNYRFKIRVKDLNGFENTYPKRLDFDPEILGDDEQAEYIEIMVSSLKNPGIEWNTFPKYYNGASDFKALITINTNNSMTGGIVRAVLSATDNVDFDAAPENYVTSSNDVNFAVTIPYSDFDEMLGYGYSGDTLLHIEAVDDQGNMTTTSKLFMLDIEAPGLEAIEPAGLDFVEAGSGGVQTALPRVTSTVIIRGVASDDQRIKSMYYSLGKKQIADGTWIDTPFNENAPPQTGLHPGSNIRSRWDGSLSTWSWRFEDIAELCNPAPSVENGNIYLNDERDEFGTWYGSSNLWILPLKFKVVDYADNVSFYETKVLVDPDADTPIVEIISHNNEDIVGGKVRLNGTAIDNEHIHSVEIRITAQDDNNCFPGGALNWNVTGGFVTISGLRSGSTASWYYELNEDMSLNPPSDKVRRVLVELRARDASIYTPDIPKTGHGTTARIYLDFDSKVPTIPEIFIYRGEPAGIRNAGGPSAAELSAWKSALSGAGEVYSTGSTVSGFITLKAKVRDESGITSIKLRGQESHTYTEYFGQTSPMFRNGVLQPWVEEIEGGAMVEYWVYVPFDTNGTLYNNNYVDRSGSYTMEVQIEDAGLTPYIAQNTWLLAIDNFYPLASYEGYIDAKGSRFNIAGTARDYKDHQQPVQYLDKVVVYFSREGSDGVEKGISLLTGNAGDFTASAQGAKGTAVSDPYVVDGKLTIFPDVLQSGGWTSTRSGIVINSTALIEDNAGNRYSTSWNGVLPYEKNWGVEFDTTRFTDGPVTLHYVVFDRAGNATHYYKKITVKNNPPRIGSITLSTDLVGGVAYNDWDPAWAMPVSSTGYKWDLTNSFMARNNALAFKIAGTGGNGGINYRVSYIEGYEAPVSVGSGQLLPGQIYEVASLETDTDWPGLGFERVPAVGDVFLLYKGITGTAGTSTVRMLRVSSTHMRETTAAGSNPPALIFPSGSFGPEAGKVNDGLKSFLVKVFDTMTQGGEAEQLADFRIITVKVENDDITPPKISAAPFGEKYVLQPEEGHSATPVFANDMDKILGAVSSYNENIVTLAEDGGTVRKGYVQYHVHSGNGTADVSGKVVFTGKASDNQRISRITAAISGYDPDGGGPLSAGGEFTVAEWNQAERRISPLSGHSIPAMAPDTSTVEWAFEIEDQGSRRENQYLTLGNGHVLNWRFAWDSAVLRNAEGITVTFKVYDARQSVPNANLAPDPQVKVDTVPYIQGIKTALSGAYPSNPSAFSRSALGWYPVRESAANETIVISGFNLWGFTPNNGPSDAAVSVNGTDLYCTARGKYSITARVDNDAAENNANTVTSGALVVSVNGINSINNTNNNTAPYNTEPNNLNNNTLTDDRYLYVWNIGALISSNQLTSPFMRMDRERNIYMSYGKGSNSMYFYKNGERPTIEQCYNKYHNTTIAFDSSGNIYGAATNTDRISNALYGATSFTFYSREQGNEWNGTSANYNEGTNKRRLELSYNSSTDMYNINRVQIPRIAVTGAGTSGNPAKIYMSYFDGNNNSNPVVFRYGTVTSPNGITGGIASNITSNATGTANGRVVVADNSTAYKGGLYTAVGALSDGRAVIAWYDSAAHALVFSYSGVNPSGVNTQTWQNNAKVIDSDFAGWHVDMAVDSDDGIHLAYYTNGNGGLRYAYLERFDAEPEVVWVDTYLSAGNKLMINVREETRGGRTVQVPYISHYHASFAQTTNSVRVSWRVNFDELLPGTDAANRFTGAWESMTVPAASVPQANDFVCNGVPSIPGPLSAQIANTSRLRKDISVHNSVFLGYHTDMWYEGAILKGDISALHSN